jgi:hypothetical protein
MKTVIQLALGFILCIGLSCSIQNKDAVQQKPYFEVLHSQVIAGSGYDIVRADTMVFFVASGCGVVRIK